MPDVTIRTETRNKKTVSMEIKTAYDRKEQKYFSYYAVYIFSEYGQTIAGNVYSINDKKNANACFRRYLKRAET